eukprot:6539426-Alexandrium_andersonii.AAC.1
MARRGNDLPTSAVSHGLKARSAMPADRRLSQQAEARPRVARALQKGSGVARPSCDVGGVTEERRPGATQREGNSSSRSSPRRRVFLRFRVR